MEKVFSLLRREKKETLAVRSGWGGGGGVCQIVRALVTQPGRRGAVISPRVKRGKRKRIVIMVCFTPAVKEEKTGKKAKKCRLSGGA